MSVSASIFSFIASTFMWAFAAAMLLALTLVIDGFLGALLSELEFKDKLTRKERAALSAFITITFCTLAILKPGGGFFEMFGN